MGNSQDSNEPVAWRYSVQPQVLGAACWAFSDTKDVPDAQPLYTSPPQRKPEPVALDWLHKWANQDDGEPETQWHEGYEAARRVVQIHLTAPPQRKPLTDEAIGDIYVQWDATPGVSHADFARAIERAHGIGGKDE